MKDSEKNMYRGLATYVLPAKVLDYFDVVDFVEEPVPDTGCLYHKILHLYLDEQDNRPSDMQNTRPNGFTEERHILDFPIRDHKTILHVRRRRWLTADEHNYLVPLEKLTHDKTQYSKEFALF